MRARIGGRAIAIDDKRVKGGVEGHASTLGAQGRLVTRREPVSSSAPSPYNEVREGPWTLFIDGPLPGMNDYISTGSRLRYNAHKKRWEKAITRAIVEYQLQPIPCAWFCFHWMEKWKRRNPDNFASIGKKFIFDAMVKAGILENDGWDQILGWEDRWMVDINRPGVYVEIFLKKPE